MQFPHPRLGSSIRAASFASRYWRVAAFSFFAGLAIVSYLTINRQQRAEAKLTRSKTNEVTNQALAQQKGEVAIHAAGLGRPFLNLRDGQEIEVEYRGDQQATTALRSGQARTRSLTTIDLDGNATPDLIVGYSYNGIGLITIQRGNPDAFAPQDQSVFARMQKGYDPDSLLPIAETYQVPGPVDFIQAGDFNHDNLKDVLAATRGGDLFLLAGNENGTLTAPQRISLPGTVTALEAGEFRAADGKPDLAVCINGPRGAELLVFDGASGGLTASPIRFSLLGEPLAIRFGGMDADPFLDIAVATKTEIEIVHGWGRKQTPSLQSLVEQVSAPGDVRGIALGHFIWDREGRDDIATLSSNGTINVLQPVGVNTRPFSDDEIFERARGRSLKTSASKNIDVESVRGWRPADTQGWIATRQINTGAVAGDALDQSLLTTANISFRETSDLLVTRGDHDVSIVRQTDRRPDGEEALRVTRRDGRRANHASSKSLASASMADLAQVSLSSEDSPIAVLALPQKLNGERSLVVLHHGGASPTIVPIMPFAAITVDRTDDPSGASLAAASVCGVGANDCSLRGAVQFANANSGTTINLSTATYILSTSGSGGCVTENAMTGNTIGDLEINETTTVIGTGSGNTVIRQAAATNDRVICMDVPLTSGKTFTFSGLTITGGRDDSVNGGAGILGGAKGTTLNLTDVKFVNNQTLAASFGGGGATVTGGDMNVTNCTFGAANPPGANRNDLTLANASFTSGGGLSYTSGDPGGTNGATGTLKVVGTTFTHNTAAGIGGGGLDVFGLNVSTPTVTVSTSSFTSNQGVAAATSGGGMINEAANVTLATTSFTSNSVLNRGGALYIGGGTTLLDGTNPSLTFASNNTAPNNPSSSSISTASALNVSGTNTTIGGSIEISAGGVWTTNAGTNVNPTDILIDGGTMNCNNSTMNITGNLKLGPSGNGIFGGNFNGNTGTVNLSGNLTTNSGGTSPVPSFTAGTNFNFVGSGPQSSGGTLSPTFVNLTVNKTNTLTLGVNSSVTGNLTVTAGTFDLGVFTVNRSAAGGTLTVSNGTTLKIGGTNPVPANYNTHAIGGTSTIEYSGANQTVSTLNSSQNYANLIISGSGTKTLQGATTVLANLTINGGTLDVSASNFALNVAGNWANNAGAANFNGRGGTVSINGSGAQSIGGSASTTFNTLQVNNSGNTVTLGANASLSGNFTLTSGTFNLSTFTANRTVAGGTLTLSNGTLLKIGGTNTLPANYSTHSVGTTSSVEYSGSNQNVAALNSSQLYGNLTTSGSGTKTLAGAISVAGPLTIGSGTTLDASASNFAINAAGNWTNNGTFTPRSGTVTFNGSSGTQTLVGNTAFFDLTLNNSGATTDFGSTSITVGHNLTTTAGTMNGNTSTFTFTNASGTISGAAAKSFNNLIINSGASISNLSGGSTTIKKDFTNGGTFTQDTSLTTTFDASNLTHNLSGAGTTTFGITTINVGTTVNAGSHNFNVVGSSFTANGTFTGSTGTVTFNGAVAQSIRGTGSKNFNGLTINNAAGVTVNDVAGTVDASVGGLLTLTTDLTVASGAILQQSGASAGAADVIGKIRRTDLDATSRAFGNPNVTIAINSGTAPNPMDVTLAKAAPVDFVTAVQRTYTLAPTGGSGISATVKLHYLAGELNGNTEAKLGLWRKGATWVAQGRTGTVDTVNKAVTLSGVSSFSDWTLAQIEPPTVTKGFLPVTIQSGGTSTVTVTLTNTNASALTNSSFTDTLVNMTAVGGAVTGTCVGTTPSTLSAGATALSFTGITIPASGNCTVVFNVTSSTTGTNPNSTSGVTTAQTPVGSGSAAVNLTVMAAPSITKGFSPATIAAGGTSTVTLQLSNPNSSQLTGAAFSDTLTNMSAVGGPVTGTCVGTTPNNLSAGATALGFTGITIPPSGNCTVIFDVTSTHPGSNPNTTSGVTTTQTSVPGAVSNTPTLTVISPPSIAKVFTPNSIELSGTTSLTFTITNPATNTVQLNGVAVTDNLPSGLTVATLGPTPTCGGTLTTTNPTSIVLAGATIAANGQCQFSVTVTGASTGTYLNTTGNVSSTNGGTGNIATANLDVDAVQLVNDAGDADDATPGDGVCLTAGGVCTLRAAIEETNALAGDNQIGFTPGLVGPILLTSDLPDISGGLVVKGPGANQLTVSGASSFRVFNVNVASPAIVTISGLTVAKGSATTGAALQNVGTASVTVINSTLSDNSASDGGAIYNAAAGTITIINSTLSTNSATTGNGGGIGNLTGTINVINSTLNGNSATAVNGGGIYNSSGTVNITNCTVTGNSATAGAGGGIFNSSGTVNLGNTIIALNSAGSGADLSGVFNSLDYNLIKDITDPTFTGTTTHNITGQDPLLGPLQDNGGVTFTQALLTGSPAIEAAIDAPLTTLSSAVADTLTTSVSVTDATTIPAGARFVILIDGEQMVVVDKTGNDLTVTRGINGTTAATHANAASVLPAFDQRGVGFPRRADSTDSGSTQTVDIGAFELHPSIEDIGNQVTNEDVALPITFNVGDDAIGFTSIVASSSNTALVTSDTAHLTITGSGATRLLTITPNTNANSPANGGPTTITVTVTATNGQVASDTFLLTVSAVNSPPVLAANTGITVNEGSTGNLIDNTKLMVTDADNTAAQLTYTLGTAPTRGSLKKSGTLLASTDTFTQDDINNNLITYDHDDSETTSDSFSFTVSDGAGGTIGSTNFNITVTPVNDLPILTANNGVNVIPGPTVTIDNTRLLVSDADNTAAQLVFTIGTVPAHGTLKKSGSPLSGGSTFTQDDINSNRITFTHNGDAANSDSFTFTVSDGAGGTIGTTTFNISIGCALNSIVSNTNDNGAGSLRDAIVTACPGGTITFNTPSSTIALTSADLVINKSLTINGPGANLLTVQRSTAGGTPNFRVFTTAGALITVNISGLTISNGHTANGTAGVSGGDGGGIFNIAGATLNLKNVAISGNATGNGGSGAVGGNGGGIYNDGTLALVNSTISGNLTGNGTTAGTDGGSGAGIYNTGTLDLTNCTISGNQTGNGISGNGGDGGGIFVNSGTLSLTNCTISGNQTGNGGGGNGGSGGGIFNAGTTNSKNTIVAGNLVASGGFAPDFGNTLNSQDYNLIGNTSGATVSGTTTHDIYDQIANLGALASNGGPTQTLLPLPGSPAINAGDPANLPADSFDLDGDSNTAELLPFDQRGFVRVVGAKFDIGAAETNYVITSTAGTSQSVVITNVFPIAMQVNVTESGTNQTGLPVTFTPPVSGASGTFSGSARVNTDAGGLATAPPFTANNKSGSYNVVASLSSGTPATNFPLTNLPGNQTINVNTHAPAVAEYASSFTVAATTTSGLPVVFNSAGGCSNVGAIFTMTSSTAACIVKYDQPGNADYNPAPQITESVSAQKGNQTITFSALPDKTFGDPDFNVGALATSGLAVSFAASGQCTISLSTVHITGAGTCTITAKQAGDANFNPATDVPQLFNIAKATPTNSVLSSINPSDVGQSVTFTATLSSPAGIPTGTVQFKDNGNNLGAAQALNAGAVATLQTSSLSAGAHTITAIYSGNANFATNTGTLAPDQQVTIPGARISLSQSNYNVNEATGVVTITVNRSGDVSTAVTVDYATSDIGASPVCSTLNSGLASARCDFGVAFGTLGFAATETQKTFVIPITQDSFSEGPEQFVVILSTLTGTNASFAMPASATVTINDSTAPAPNASDDTDAFVRQQYRDFLNREADPAGLAFWSGEINNCTPKPQCTDVKRINTSAAFFLSVEFQQSGALVRNFYVAALDRPLTNNMPAFVEFERDTQAVQRGVIVDPNNNAWQTILNNNRDAFMKDFVTRPEFVGLYPTTDTPAQYVDRLYLHAAVTPATPAERQAAIAEFGGAITALEAGARGRALFDVTQNATFQAREVNRSFVQMEYFGYLRRNPNDSPDSNFAGYDFWVSKLNQFNGNFVQSEMVKSFIFSGEYRHRFGP